jgi:hypothetical protein
MLRWPVEQPMNGFGGRALVVVAVWLSAWAAALPASAELADVYLANGLRLRGDVVVTDTEVVVRNAAGEVRLVPAEVLRIERVRSATSQPGSASAPATLPASRPAAPPARPEIAPAPPISDRDIQRLKIGELALDGAADPVRVRFLRKGRQRDLPTEVLEQLRRRANYRPEWEDVLTRGQPHEKLQLIIRETGAEHADRIVVEGDPSTFALFRRRILPLVNRGCARAGCHGGRTARVFRFPQGSPSSDTYAYTTFILLDQLETPHGPLLNRTNPEGSVLLSYLMPPELSERGHPPVGKGPSFKPVLRDVTDRQYRVVLEWINSLLVPRPDYGLEYENPYAGRRGAPADAGAAEPPAESQPAPESPPADALP